MQNLIELILDIEETESKFMKIFFFILRTGGGLVWTIFYSFILYLSWKYLQKDLRIILIFPIVIMVIMSYLYPYSWERYYRKRRKNFDEIKEAYHTFYTFCIKNKIWDEKTNFTIPDEMNKLTKLITEFYEKLKPLKVN